MDITISRKLKGKVLDSCVLPASTILESESESEIFIRSFQTQETSAKTITGRCRRGHLGK